MIEIRAHSADSLQALRGLMDDMKAGALLDRAKVEELGSSMAERQEQIEQVLGRFQFSGSPQNPRQDTPRLVEEKTTTEV